jgi:LDH2 family malate/lactate/ureidoglycolate dehydrogenase
MPLASGMIGMYFAVGNANHLPPWGGLDMLLSTNPLAVAIPAGQRSADRARHGDDGRRLRQGEGARTARRVDAGRLDDRPQGKPLTDPKRAAEGLLLPLGGAEAGYKGYGWR